MHTEHFPAKAAIFKSLVVPLDFLLRSAIVANTGINPNGFYRHQAIAIDALRSGKHVVVSSSTASGKSLIYSIPVIEAILKDASATAICLFPTKALAQDQLRAFSRLCGFATDGSTVADGVQLPIFAKIVDGDTAEEGRKEVMQGGAQVLMTNPDFLHLTILRKHENWKIMFKRLEVVVIDEGHCYTGAFGAHVACVLRRLLRICALYGSTPLFVVCSATVANPLELMTTLLPRQFLGGVDAVCVVGREDDGSPHGNRVFGIWNAPFRSEIEESSSSYSSSEKNIEDEVEDEVEEIDNEEDENDVSSFSALPFSIDEFDFGFMRPSKPLLQSRVSPPPPLPPPSPSSLSFLPYSLPSISSSSSLSSSSSSMHERSSKARIAREAAMSLFLQGCEDRVPSFGEAGAKEVSFSRGARLKTMKKNDVNKNKEIKENDDEEEDVELIESISPMEMMKKTKKKKNKKSTASARRADDELSTSVVAGWKNKRCSAITQAVELFVAIVRFKLRVLLR